MITTGRLRGGEPQQLRKADPLVIMGKWRSGQPGSHDHDRGDGSGRERSSHDHGSLVAGAWRAKSETARPAHSQPAPPLLMVSSRPNRTKHTPNR